MLASERASSLVLFLAALALPLGACSTATGAAIPLVRVHAEHDLDCDGRDIRIEEQLGGKYKAIGCGRKATYRTACEALACTVVGDDEQAIPWKDRPAPIDP